MRELGGDLAGNNGVYKKASQLGKRSLITPFPIARPVTGQTVGRKTSDSYAPPFIQLFCSKKGGQEKEMAVLVGFFPELAPRNEAI